MSAPDDPTSLDPSMLDPSGLDPSVPPSVPAQGPPGRAGVGDPAVAPVDPAVVAAAVHASLEEHMTRIERLVAGAGRQFGPLGVIGRAGGRVPAWLRPTAGEGRWPVALVMLVAIALQLVPDKQAIQPPWALPAAELTLLVLLIAVNPGRLNRQERWIRVASLGLVALVSAGNAWAAVNLVRDLVTQPKTDAVPLLMTGGAIWLTNVIVFGLWYWEFDRGGPAARSMATKTFPDFLFPQMQAPELAEDGWEPTFIDYLYVSFTNAMAFSPTDTLPLSRWAKALMLAQSGVSLITMALVVARAVNVLGS